MKWDLPPGDKPKLEPQRWLGNSRTTWRFSSLGEASINIYNWRISAAMFDYRRVYTYIYYLSTPEAEINFFYLTYSLFLIIVIVSVVILLITAIGFLSILVSQMLHLYRSTSYETCINNIHLD